MKKETQQILNDLKAKGFDISGIEHQIQVNPLLEKGADDIIGGGLLRQSNYTQYMNKVAQQEKEIKEQATKLATLHDANAIGALPAEALSTMKAMEEALIETGMFTESSIKELSAVGRKPLEELINNPIVKDPPVNAPNLNNERVDDMPNNVDLSNYIDAPTFEKATGNIALGSILTNMQLQSKIDEVRSLGIPVTSEKINSLQEELKKGFAQGTGNLDDMFEKTFEVSKVREAKATEAMNLRITEEANKIVAERMKKENIPGRGNGFRGTPPPVFGRKSTNYVNSAGTEGNNNEGFRDAQGNIDISKLPKNDQGDPKIFLLRGDRSSRVATASEAFGDLMQKAEGDPFFID